jgi:hypothetical protein
MAHTCHAHGCTAVVPPRMFACLYHWRALPVALQRAIWCEYRAGQERTKATSVRYMAVQRRAVGVLAFKPNDERAAAIAAPYLIESEIWRREAIAAGQGDPLEGIAGTPETSPIVSMSDEQAWVLVRTLRREAQT